jgi:hypothetical protein
LVCAVWLFRRSELLECIFGIRDISWRDFGVRVAAARWRPAWRDPLRHRFVIPDRRSRVWSFPAVCGTNIMSVATATNRLHPKTKEEPRHR